MHRPVLLNEAIEFLDPKQGNFIIDGTAGAGGHFAEILKKILPDGIMLGVDLDKAAIEELTKKISAIVNYPVCVESSADRQALISGNIILAQGNYADLPEILKQRNLPKANGLLLDLGFSSIQLEKSGRGFSFLRNEPLDMRYCTDSFRQNSVYGGTAAEAINQFSEKELADIIYKYGEERYARRIAKKIVEGRRKKKILTTFDLVDAIKKAVPIGYQRRKIHFATRTFQGLRIYVNDELGNLERLLNELENIVKSGGRIVIISFHSLEDRMVKNKFKELAKIKKVKILTKKPIIPQKEEIFKNPRARSAKLRAIEIQ